MSENEVWKDIAGYEGLYKVSNKGHVRGVERKDSIGRKCGGRTLIPTCHNGYLQVILSKNSIRKTKRIHRLVAQAFLPNADNHPEVNHRDEIKTNNELSNLEWCDSSYNTNYGTRNTRVRQKLSKKVKGVNVETGEVVTFSSTKEAGKKGYDNSSVARACRGDYKDGNRKLIGDGHLYRGHKWSYE